MNKKYIIKLILLLLFVTTKVSAQNKVSGQVTSIGETLPGVSVVEKGVSNSTVTDNNGNFSITVKENAILLFSFIGMETMEVPVTGNAPLNIEMKESTNALEDVVVIGYGTQKKVNLSGAVDQVSGDVLENRPIANVSQGLQGLVPNLNVRFNSGAPGEAADINIRGITSINGGGPLIMVDGVPVSSAELNRISPQDIASISVIKDASAAAIYGARASFGVILITTKVGTKGGVNVNYSNNFTWNKPTVIPDKITDPYIFSRLLELSTDNTPWDNVNYDDQFYKYAKERSDDPSIPGVRINPTNPESWEYMGGRDWTKYFLSDLSFTQNHDLSISGVSDNQKINYYLSTGYNRQNSPVKLADDYFDRYSIRSKVNYKIKDWIKVGNNTVISNTLRNQPTDLSMFNIYNAFPTSFDKNPDGSWANSEVGRSAAAMVDGGKTTDKQFDFQSTFNTELSFFDSAFKINGDYTFQRNSENYNWYRTKYLIGYGPDDIREEGENSAYRRAGFTYSNLYNIYGTLSKTFNQHALTAILGFNQEDYRYEQFTVEKQGLISASFPTIGLATGTTLGNEKIDTYALRGAFYRLNYIFDDKYIVEFNGRYDGSSRFPRDKRFGFFPSGSVAWRLDRESFMESTSDYISSFKLRASYGELGNQNVLNYGYLPSMGINQSSYLINGERSFAISTPGLVSPNYTWEKVNTLNFGVDLAFFENKINLSFDKYTRNTLGMLTLGRELPNVLGADEPNENAADLRTQGWELSVGYNNRFDVRGSQLGFDAKFVLSDSRSKITRFDNPNKSILQYYKGMELGEIWGLESDGLFQNTAEIEALDQTSIIPWGALSIVPGWPKYKDQDDNGIIEKGYILGETKDLKIIGNSTPRFQFGLDLGMDWKGFDLRMFLQGIGKRDYYPLDYLYWGHYQQPYGSTYGHLMDFYRPSDDSNAQRAKHSQAYLNAGLANQNLNSTYPILQSWLADVNLGTRIDESQGLAIPQTAYMQSAAYLRMKNLTFGYTIPDVLSQKAGLDKVRIYFSGENLFEFSSIKKYYDPEGVNQNTYTDPRKSPSRSGNGMDYPFQRSYSVGLQVTF